MKVKNKNKKCIWQAGAKYILTHSYTHSNTVFSARKKIHKLQIECKFHFKYTYYCPSLKIDVGREKERGNSASAVVQQQQQLMH